MTTPPLPDLHRHLDGSLRPETFRELARGIGTPHLAIPRFTPHMGLKEALSCFATTLSLLQSPAAVRRVATEICEDAEEEGVSTLEIRFAPQLHRGATVEAIIDAALEGIDGRAGLILCGLYGEDPAQLTHLVRCASARKGVVGIDLAGGPSPHHRFAMEHYAEPFALACDRGLGRTVHAGEGRPPQEIRVAVEQLHAQRIGHGTTLAGDPATIELLLKRGVVIEACITSNHHTGAIDSPAAHPAVQWLQRGILVTFCSDNTLLSATDSRTEHALAAQLPGITPEMLRASMAAGHAAAFKNNL